jgi:hypothetical protein
LALFVVIELEVAEPLLDIRVFRYWPYTNSLLLIAVLMIGLFGILFYIPLFLQQVQGLGAFDAGLTLLPQAVVMGVLMPITGRVYDRIGPRWPAVIGLTIVAVATYLMHNLTVDTSREQLVLWMMLRAVGLGLAMMPIMAGGIAVIPPEQVNAASAFNNVAQRTAGALGIAVLTAILTTQQAQQLAGRAALLPTDTATPHLGGPAVPDWVGAYALYQQTQLQVFVAGLDDLFLIAAGLSALGALGALLLRSGPAPATPASVVPRQQATTATAPTIGAPGPNGAVANGAVANGTVADGTVANGAVANGSNQARPHAATDAADNGSRTRQADGPLDVEHGARHPET